MPPTMKVTKSSDYRFDVVAEYQANGNGKNQSVREVVRIDFADATDWTIVVNRRRPTNIIDTSVPGNYAPPVVLASCEFGNDRTRIEEPPSINPTNARVPMDNGWVWHGVSKWARLIFEMDSIGPTGGALPSSYTQQGDIINVVAGQGRPAPWEWFDLGFVQPAATGAPVGQVPPMARVLEVWPFDNFAGTPGPASVYYIRWYISGTSTFTEIAIPGWGSTMPQPSRVPIPPIATHYEIWCPDVAAFYLPMTWRGER